MIVKVYGMTDVGKRRELNEDSYKIYGFENNSPLGFCVLADGMGGHNAGEVASQNAVDIISNELAETLKEVNGDKINLNIASAIDFANSRIYEMSTGNSEQAGMGTTTIVACVKDDCVRIANIGDSRVYAISEDGIFKITVDHSVVEQLVQRGTITLEEARVHPDKNIITRALGTEAFVDADFYEYKVQNGEVILLCSDGLTEMLYENEIKDIVCNAENIKTAVEELIAAANNNGGVDNITVVAIQFKQEDLI